MAELILEVNSYIRVIGHFRDDAHKDMLIKITQWDRDPNSNIVWFESNILFDFDSGEENGSFRFNEVDVNIFEVFDIIDERTANDIISEVTEESETEDIQEEREDIPQPLFQIPPVFQGTSVQAPPSEFQPQENTQIVVEPNDVESIPINVVNVCNSEGIEREFGEKTPLEVSGTLMKNLDKVVGFLTEELFKTIDKAIETSGHKMFMNLSEENQAKLISQKISSFKRYANYDINFEEAFVFNIEEDNEITAINIGGQYWFIIESNYDDESIYKSRSIIEIPSSLSNKIKAKKIENTFNLEENLVGTNLNYGYLKESCISSINYTFKNYEEATVLDNDLLEKFGDGWIQALQFNLVEFQKNSLPEEILEFIDPTGLLRKGSINDLRKAG